MQSVALRAIALAGLYAALTGIANAQAPDTYPDRPIKVVVPAAAGGVTDTPARIVTNRMRDNLGQTLVIENQGGAGGILAAENVKRAAPDGYTLLYVNAATHGLLPALKKSMPYDALKDFCWISMLSDFPFVFVTYPDHLEKAGYAIGLWGKGWGPGSLMDTGRIAHELRYAPQYMRDAAYADFIEWIGRNRDFYIKSAG
jgi:tripartite-type tricarboxylate transporter receptor subunit TctC